MKLTQTHKIILSAVVLIVLLSVYIYIDHHLKSKEQNNIVSTTTATTTSGTNILVSGNGGYTITPVAINSSASSQMPNLKSPVVFGTDPSLTPDVRAMIQQKISTVEATLLKNPSDFDSWINLGIYQKQAEDYSATVASWQYAGTLAPMNFISFGDLGDLYAYFLHNSAQAEVYYKQAITNGPTQDYLYIQLAQVYHDIEKDNAKTLAIINQGLSQIPNDPALLQFKASLNQ